MKTRTTRRGIVLGLAVMIGAAGCNDPTEPAPTPSGAAFTADVLIPARFASDPALTAHVSAWLTPGRAEDGTLREVQSPLRVSEQPIQLVPPPRSDWAFVQSVVVPLSPVEGRATFVVQSPVIDGVQPTIGVTKITTVRLVEPDTVRIDADGSLTLHPSLDARGGDPPTSRRWTLVLSGSASLSLDVAGPLPEEIRVPRELIPPPAPSGWQVTFTVNDTYGPPSLPKPGGQYDVIVRVSQPFLRTLLRASSALR